MASKQRTDEHAPSRIVPANYTIVCSYSTDAQFYAGINLTDVALSESVARNAGFAIFGRTGKCGVCGAVYRYGDLWIHMTGELVHVGHDCASKYELLANRSEWQLAHERELRRMQIARARERNIARRAAMFVDHPGLERALTLDHYITRDIARRFTNTGKLSDRQIELLLKLQTESDARAQQALPLGRPPVDAMQARTESITPVDYANDGFPF